MSCGLPLNGRAMGVRDIKIEDAKGRVFDPQEFKKIMHADRT